MNDATETQASAEASLASLSLHRQLFFTVARDADEIFHDVVPDREFLGSLLNMGVDIVTILERSWCNSLPKPPSSWKRENDNVAIIKVTSYADWWNAVGQKTQRRMVRRAKKMGISTQIVEPSDHLAKGIWRIYNETPIRQDRSFPHYGDTEEMIKKTLLGVKNSIFIGAYYRDELIGFVHLIFGDRVALMSQLLSLQQHFDKAPNNALVAKSVEVCSDRHVPYLMYGRFGNHPSLDLFKQNNGFVKVPVNRFYIPLTRKGVLAIKLRVHQEIKDALPEFMKYSLIPLVNWVDRTRARTLIFIRRIV